MKKTFNILAKTFTLISLICAVCSGDLNNIATAQVHFNNAWN